LCQTVGAKNEAQTWKFNWKPRFNGAPTTLLDSMCVTSLTMQFFGKKTGKQLKKDHVAEQKILAKKKVLHQ
jgi:hypothetical protein